MHYRPMTSQLDQIFKKETNDKNENKEEGR